MAYLRTDEPLPEGVFPPGSIDSMLRQTIQLCWIALPHDGRSIAALESEMRRLLDRAFADLREDSERQSHQ